MSLAESAASVDGAFTSIPIIDLGNCTTPEGRLATANQVRDACMRVGFFYVRNHGIPQPCIDKVFTAMQTYFNLPMATKMKLHHKTASRFAGYQSPLESNVDPTSSDKGDFVEGFTIWGKWIEPTIDDDKVNYGPAAGANVWPTDDCPGFREACLEYFHPARKLGKTLFPLFALALELPETYFNDKTQKSAAIMKPLHYPLQEGHPEIDDSTPGIGAHTDFECFTIIWQQPGIQALQVRNAENRWVDAPPIEGTLVVNLGDQLALWTNDVFKSTVHRAINKSGNERYSVPLFFGVDYDAIIEPIPSCVSADRPAKYAPIAAGEYLNKRLKETYHVG